MDIGKEFEKSTPVKEAILGDAKLKLMNQRKLVDFATEWITKTELQIKSKSVKTEALIRTIRDEFKINRMSANDSG